MYVREHLKRELYKLLFTKCSESLPSSQEQSMTAVYVTHTFFITGCLFKRYVYLVRSVLWTVYKFNFQLLL